MSTDKLITFLVGRLADLTTGPNPSDHYVQGQISLIREVLCFICPEMYE